jgi:uncharacterized membrane protein
MRQDLEVILWPTVYLLWATAVIFFVWAMIHRSKRRQSKSWIEYLAISVFSLIVSLIMVLTKYTGYHLSFTTRIGVVSVILGLYAYYLYRRQQK